ncbi:MAG: hypothetical protein MMC23_004938 [Stictis urceolatum]|nr:hypothetical protein [Stictis urceolata]
MCHFEKITYRCAHYETHRIAHCHFARNDPLHICSGVQVMKKERSEPGEDCENCRRHAALQLQVQIQISQQAAGQFQHHQQDAGCGGQYGNGGFGAPGGMSGYNGFGRG